MCGYTYGAGTISIRVSHMYIQHNNTKLSTKVSFNKECPYKMRCHVILYIDVLCIL